MRVIFRVDASFEIGTGHVMRCLTLADALRTKNAEVIFICRELSGNSISLISNKGFKVFSLPYNNQAISDSLTAHAQWLHETVANDVAQTVAILQDYAVVDWLIVDHYALDVNWEAALRPYANKVMVIDDLADRKHECDLLLDQNYYEDLDDRYLTLVSTNCKLLLGPKYALLRPEFIEARKTVVIRDGIVKRILIFMGGVDKDNVTQQMLDVLKKINFLGKVDVVVGNANPHKEIIRALCAQNVKCHFYCQIDNIAELMVKADLAIGAGGATTWERCCLGLPSAVITIAENQLEVAECAQRNGLLFYLGYIGAMSFTSVMRKLQQILNNPIAINKMSKQCFDLVDGLGSVRVVNQLCN